jgi:hypothetical protein
MNKISKKLMVLAMSILLVAPAFTFAQTADDQLWGGQKDNVSGSLGAIAANAKDPRVIAGSVINILMGFLGIVAVIIILMGGFKWMTAAGGEDKIDEAKKLLAAGVIGLVIILSAWGLATFVLTQILGATTGA